MTCPCVRARAHDTLVLATGHLPDVLPDVLPDHPRFAIATSGYRVTFDAQALRDRPSGTSARRRRPFVGLGSRANRAASRAKSGSSSGRCPDETAQVDHTGVWSENLARAWSVSVCAYFGPQSAIHRGGAIAVSRGEPSVALERVLGLDNTGDCAGA